MRDPNKYNWMPQDPTFEERLGKPDLTIGNPPQMLRWHLWLPGFLVRRGWQLALHKWLQSDHDRALHDHKSWNVSVLLNGCYREVLSHHWEPLRSKLRLPLVPYFRRAETPHRVVLKNKPIWTLWLRGPQFREWGFYCPKGWKHWQPYLGIKDYKGTGQGYFSPTQGAGCGD